jgi:hypothetical protein
MMDKASIFLHYPFNPKKAGRGNRAREIKGGKSP